MTEKRLASWFRFLLKHINQPGSNPAYVWHYLSFFTYWEKNKSNVVLCFNMPDHLRDKLKSSLEEEYCFHNDDPYSSHCVIAEQVPKWFDRVFWRMRDKVRDIEKVQIYIWRQKISADFQLTSSQTRKKLGEHHQVCESYEHPSEMKYSFI
jgi:hypothetical protein